MPREIPEWVGKTDDAKVPDRVRLRIWRRQCGDSNFAICPLSKTILRDIDDKQLDHEKALIEGGEHRESNLRFVHTAAHREKTKGEVARKASVDAKAKKHLGIKGRPSSLTVDRATRQAAADARSRDRRGDKLPVPSARAIYAERM